MHALISAEWGSAVRHPLNKPETSLQPENIEILNMEILERCCLITLFLCCLFMLPGFPLSYSEKDIQKYKGNIKKTCNEGQRLSFPFKSQIKKRLKRRAGLWVRDMTATSWVGKASRTRRWNVTESRVRAPIQAWRDSRCCSLDHREARYVTDKNKKRKKTIGSARCCGWRKNGDWTGSLSALGCQSKSAGLTTDDFFFSASLLRLKTLWHV